CLSDHISILLPWCHRLAFDSFCHVNDSVLMARNSTLQVKKVILQIPFHDLQILNRFIVSSHVTGHFLLLPDFPWIGTVTNRTGDAITVTTVSFITAMLVITLHPTLETATLGHSLYVDLIHFSE